MNILFFIFAVKKIELSVQLIDLEKVVKPEMRKVMELIQQEDFSI